LQLGFKLSEGIKGMNEPDKMELISMDVAAEKRDELKHCLAQAFPEVFAESSIDFDQLKRVLGEWVDPGKERFGLIGPARLSA
jgi:adenine-specific DNA-methyltransferase